MSIHLLGIRHHGPGSCRNVLEYLQELKPDLILLEGPAEAETLLPCALSEQMEPPVALLAYQPDQPQNAVFYPFAEFSPEWQTICYAMRNEVPLRFFDLPLTHSMALNQKTAEKEKDETPQDEPEKDANSNSKDSKKVMFMGSSERVLGLIKIKSAEIYPNLEVVTYSPPYKPEFSKEDNDAIVTAINSENPDLLWIGMTAPKQEKWTYTHWNELNIHCHVGTIGAVFDFFAGTAKRAPQWWQDHSLEWLYRLIIEPKRMWRRYIIGNSLFIRNILKEMYENIRVHVHY